MELFKLVASIINDAMKISFDVFIIINILNGNLTKLLEIIIKKLQWEGENLSKMCGDCKYFERKKWWENGTCLKDGSSTPSCALCELFKRSGEDEKI